MRSVCPGQNNVQENKMLTSLFIVDLTINMPCSGRHARQLLNLYLADLRRRVHNGTPSRSARGGAWSG